MVVPDVPELIIALRDQLAAVAEEAHYSRDSSGVVVVSLFVVMLSH